MACDKSSTGALRRNRAIRVSVVLGTSLETKFSQTGCGATRGLSTGNRHTRYGNHRIVLWLLPFAQFRLGENPRQNEVGGGFEPG